MIYYWISVLDKIDVAVVIGAFISIMTGIFCLAGYRLEGDRSYKKSMIVLFIIGIILTLVYIFIPSKESLAQMYNVQIIEEDK